MANVTFQNKRTTNYGTGNRDSWDLAVNGQVIGLVCHSRRPFAKWSFINKTYRDTFNTKADLLAAIENGLV